MNDERMADRRRAGAAGHLDRRRFLGMMGGAAGLLGLPGVTQAGAAVRLGAADASHQQAKPGGTLIYARNGDADSLDPHKTTTTLSFQVMSQLYDTLVAFDAQANIKPNLAKAWEISPDGLRYTFHLQPGVTFHDGTPFNAAAVKFTLDRFVNPQTQNPLRSSIGPLKTTDVVDEMTVRLTFASPFAPLLSFLSTVWMLSPTAVQKYGNDFGNHPVGSGPFKFTSWVKGDRITLARFDGFKGFHPMFKHQGAPYLDGVVYRTMPEQQARVAALQTGEVNIAEPPIDGIDQLKNDAKYALYIAQNTGELIFFEFAVHRAPFDDERVRQAVGYGVDRNALINVALNGLVEPALCTVGPGIMGGTSAVCKSDGFTHDPAKAKELLKAAGYGGKPLPATLATWTGDNREQVAQIVQNQLKQVGFDIKLATMDIGTLNARVKQENDTKQGGGFFDMMGWAWQDPDILYALFHSPGWVDGYSDPALDKMLEQQRQITDREKRLALIDQIQKFLLDHAAMVPLYSPGWNWILAAQSTVKGFQFAPFNQALLQDVSLAK